MPRAKQTKESKFITPEDFVRNLRDFFRNAKDEDTVAVGEIREQLDWVLILGEPDARQLRAAALNRVREYAANHSGDGVIAGGLWRDIVGAGLSCRMEAIDEALRSLVEDGDIVAVSGMVTTYVLPESTEET